MSMPDWFEPMAATLTETRFIDSDWTFERKLDGVRVLAFKRGREVRLFSRNRLPLTDAYPAVARAIADLPARDAVLDGEATGAWGKQGKADYHVFDVLWLNGRDLRPRPLVDRREALDTLTFRHPVARLRPLRSRTPWDDACRRGWEGVIAKRLDAPYEGRRSKQWLKMKCDARQELVIGGFTEPRGARIGLGALLVGYFEAGQFVFAGKVGTGLNDALLRELRASLDAGVQMASPFTRGTGLPRDHVQWVAPTIVVQVAFTEWTVHGKLRHPRLLGLRIDKRPTDVTRERA